MVLIAFPHGERIIHDEQAYQSSLRDFHPISDSMVGAMSESLPPSTAFTFFADIKSAAPAGCVGSMRPPVAGSASAPRCRGPR